jgi:hypothetical protein
MQRNLAAKNTQDIILQSGHEYDFFLNLGDRVLEHYGVL